MHTTQTTVVTPETVLMNGGSFAAALALAAQQCARSSEPLHTDSYEPEAATVRPASQARKAA